MVKDIPVWAPIMIDGKESGYYISENGDCWSEKTHKYLTPDYHRFGYPQYALSLGKRNHMLRISAHRLVALTFIPNPDHKPYVNHIDCDTSNPCVDNLEWVTAAENAAHMVKMGRSLKGEKNPATIYTEEEAEMVASLLEQGYMPMEISHITGLPKALVDRLKYYGKWKEVAEKYNIPKSSRPAYKPMPYHDKIMEALRKGISDQDEIFKYIDMPFDAHTAKIIRDTRYYYRKSLSKKLDRVKNVLPYPAIYSGGIYYLFDETIQFTVIGDIISQDITETFTRLSA